jgi:O-methyltransferase
MTKEITPLMYAEQICYSSKETLKFSYDMAKKFRHVPSIYVECGVAAGAQIIAMKYGAPEKVIYAFDSFEGIPLPSNKDDQMPGIGLLSETERKMLPDPGKQILKSSGATMVSEGDFWHNIDTAFGHKKHTIVTFKGWFEEVMPKLFYIMGKDFPPVSILRLDADLYNSTLVCLQHLFPNLIDGGVCIIDDYGLKGCREACEEYFNLIGYEPKYIHEPVTHFFK